MDFSNRFSRFPLNAANLFWAPLLAPGSRSITGEPLLLVRSPTDAIARARLLFAAESVESIALANGSGSYNPADFWLEEEGRILCTRAKIPALNEQELFPENIGERTIEGHSDGRRQIHFSEGHYFHDLQLCADYTSSEPWQGPLPQQPHAGLPRTRRLLEQLRCGGPNAGNRLPPLKLAVLGDSISTGANASGRSGVSPRQPGYATLLAAAIRQSITPELALAQAISETEQTQEQAGTAVTMHNFSVGGKDSFWGRSQADAVAASQPDLLIVAFGMNDASAGTDASSFAANIRAIIGKVRSEMPSAECILVSGMSPHSVWHLANQELRNQNHAALRAIADQTGDPSLAFADVRSLWDYVVSRKSFWSLTGNGVNHPNDFGHRLYAGCILPLLGI